jgi:hypothetical protein
MTSIISGIWSTISGIFTGAKTITANGQTIQVSSLISSLKALEGVNWTGLVQAIEQEKLNWQDAIVPIETILKIISLFVPPVAVAESDFEIVYPILVWMVANTHYQAPNNAGNLWPNANWKPSQPALIPAPVSLRLR